MACFGSFAAIARLNLAEAIFISQLLPILLALGAAVLLSERLTKWRIGCIATLPWGWIVPDGQTLWFLILSGVFGGFAHIAMTLAFRYAEASRLAPFEYLALFWPLLADLFIFRLSMSTSFMLAAPLILAGAAIAASEKRR